MRHIVLEGNLDFGEQEYWGGLRSLWLRHWTFVNNFNFVTFQGFGPLLLSSRCQHGQPQANYESIRVTMLGKMSTASALSINRSCKGIDVWSLPRKRGKELKYKETGGEQGKGADGKYFFWHSFFASSTHSACHNKRALQISIWSIPTCFMVDSRCPDL